MLTHVTPGDTAAGPLTPAATQETGGPLGQKQQNLLIPAAVVAALPAVATAPPNAPAPCAAGDRCCCCCWGDKREGDSWGALIIAIFV